MCHLHQTHYPICRSTITTSITLCANAKRREQRRLAGFAETDIWCTKRTSECGVNRFEVCWKCASQKTPSGTDAKLRLVGRLNDTGAESRRRIYGETKWEKTDDEFWASDAETLLGDTTPPLKREFALVSSPNSTHLRLRDEALMQNAKVATEQLQGMTMGPITMAGTPIKVMPKMDILNMPRTPLRGPKVGRFYQMSFAKGVGAAKVIFQKQAASSPCGQGTLIESQMEQGMPLSRNQTSGRRQGTILERGDDNREETRGTERRRSGMMMAPKTPTLYTPASIPRLSHTARLEGPALEHIEEMQGEDENDKANGAVKTQQTEQKKDVLRMEKNARTIKENAKTTIKIGCPTLGYTKVIVEDGAGEEKELTKGQIFERRRQTLRILEGK